MLQRLQSMFLISPELFLSFWNFKLIWYLFSFMFLLHT